MIWQLRKSYSFGYDFFKEEVNKVKREFSCGAILYTIEDGVRKYVLIMEANGTYGFPKGHRRSGETEIEAALREIKEETGVNATIFPNLKRTIHYTMPNKNIKEVIYYAAKFENQELIPEDTGILAAKKFDIESALSMIRFQQVRDILVEIDYILEMNGEK